MKAPMHVTRVIRNLYMQCTANMLFDGSAVGIIDIMPGVKEGCPMSGLIVTLVLDPLVRHILSMSVVGSIRLTAFADHIGIVLVNLFVRCRVSF